MPRRDPTAPQLDRSTRVEALGARAIAALPPAMQVRLSGGVPVVRDGQRLDPATQATLALVEKRIGKTQPGHAGVAAERALLRRQALIGGGLPEPVASVRDLDVDGAEGPLRARFYATPERGGPHPLLVFFHGGGFVLGDLDSHDSVCRLLCVHSGVDVLSVAYRLAPEHPFPAAPDDARAAFAWAVANAAELGSDPTRIAVGGDSAGGNLAASVSIWARDNGGPKLRLQLLAYPVTDAVARAESYRLFADGYGLNAPTMEWFFDHYAPERGNRGDWRVSPLRAASLAGLPPALVITAGYDPLRDEGRQYADALSAAFTRAQYVCFERQIHGFITMSRVIDEALAAVDLCGAALHRALAA